MKGSAEIRICMGPDSLFQDFEPEGASRVFQAQGHVLLEPVLMMLNDSVIGQDDFISRRIHQQCSEQVRFRPCPVLFSPSDGILKRLVDVMDVHDDTGRESGKHFEEKVIDVAPQFADVTAIDEVYQLPPSHR